MLLIQLIEKTNNFSDPPFVTLTCSTIQWERKKAREFVIKNHTEKTGLSCIMFDGRRDWRAIETNDKLLQSKEIEEHISIIAEPGSCNMDHVAPETGKVSNIAKEILSVLSETDSVDSLAAICVMFVLPILVNTLELSAVWNFHSIVPFNG